MSFLVVAALGIAVGLISSFLGLGGGVLLVPLLPTVAGIGLKEAVATSLVTIFLVVVNNTYSFHRRREIDWGVAFKLGPLTALGAYLSARWALHWPDIYAQFLLGLVLAILLLRAVLERWPIGLRNSKPIEPKAFSLEGDSARLDNKEATTLHGLQKLLPWSVGLGAGVLSGVTGIGSGLVVSPVLMQFKLVPSQKVAPTANAVMLFTTFFGAWAYIGGIKDWKGWTWGFVHLDIVLIVLSMALVSAFWGRRQQALMSSGLRQFLLSTILFLLLLKVLWSLYFV